MKGKLESSGGKGGYIGGGDDRLFGQKCSDTLEGGDGNDYLYGEHDNDTLLEGRFFFPPAHPPAPAWVMLLPLPNTAPVMSLFKPRTHSV